MSTTQQIFNQAVDLLRQADYQVFENPLPEFELCFELMARHKSQRSPSLLVKIIENIDNIKAYLINELKLLSRLMVAIPMIIGCENRRSKLENDSLYLRDDLISLNIDTFSRVIKTPQLPLAIAKQGGFFIDIDGAKMSLLREAKGISRQDLAKELDVSPKAIAHYERKGMRPSVEHARKMHEILGEPVVVPLDFYEQGLRFVKSYRLNNELHRRISGERKEFMEMINEIVSITGFKAFWSRVSPYDILIYKEDESDQNIKDVMLVGGMNLDHDFDSTQHQVKREFLRDVPQNGAFIYEEDELDMHKVKEEAVPYLVPKDLKTLEHPDEFRKLIHRRKIL